MADTIDWFLSLDADHRAKVFTSLSQPERQALLDAIEYRTINPWAKYLGKPVALVEEGFGERIWSKQKEILESLIVHKRTAVPACHAPGKTHIAARAVAYWVGCHPPGTVKVLTTATTFRQVKRVLWPHIRRLQRLHMPNLGYTNLVEWMAGDPLDAVAEGFKPPDDDEASAQGSHAPNMLIVVDEAGGIKSGFGGNLESMTMGPNTRLLLLGNPSTDAESTWFEQACSSPNYNVIRIAAQDTPNFTREETDYCTTCPIGTEPHRVATHLVDKEWVDGIREEFGEDSAYYIARVLARFPKDNTSKTLPLSWLEAAVDNEDTPEGPIRLGVDVASDGGDEFAIAKLDGWHATIEHAKAGADNEDAVHVAGVVAEHIDAAEELHRARGIQARVRVKIDAIGVGWGVVSILQNWKREGRFAADIVPVNVSEKARDAVKYVNQRAEMWWAFRKLIQPDPNGEQLLWLDVQTKELAQLNGPTYSTNSTGRIVIESKKSLKDRGRHSPDRAEALLLAAFEPPTSPTPTVPVSLKQVNAWSL